MYRAQTDANHGEIKEAFERLGFSVWDARAVGGGFPDLVLGKAGHTYLVEVKTAVGKLNEKQVSFIAKHLGRVYVVRSVEDVEKFAKEAFLNLPIRIKT